MAMRAAAVAAAAMLFAAPGGAAEKPLWEFGLGAGVLAFDDYRGADSAHALAIPVPYIVYRGKFLKADYDGVRGQFLRNRIFDLTVSLNATTPVSSRDDDARDGMPNLEPTFEVGPEVNVHLFRSADRRVRLELQLPLRRAITLTAHPQGIGWIGAPCLDVDFFGVGGHAGWNTGVQFGPLFADRDFNRHYYEVAANYATAARPRYRPGGGYSGTELLIGTSRRFPKFWVFAFARYDSLAGATFAASPLVRSNHYWFGGVGFAWMIGQSRREVRVDD